MFKESMMLFACPERVSSAQAMRHRRQILADELVSLTRATVGARESSLSFLIRYLLLICIQFKSPVITPAEQPNPLDDLICDLLLCDASSSNKTTRIMWQTDFPSPTMFSCRGEYKEADVQCLPERVNISRQESIESLRFTNGDVCAALRNELGRVLVNRDRFRALVVNYCAARGLCVFETTTDSVPGGPQSQYPMLSSDQQRVVVAESLVSSSSLSKFSVMCKLQALAEKGDFDAFLKAAGQLDVDLVESAPLLDFRIGQCQMLRYIRRGEYEAALEVMQQKLGPLAKRGTEFLPYIAQTTTLLVFAPSLNSPEVTTKRRKRNSATDKGVSHSDAETQHHSGREGDKRIRHTGWNESTVSGGATEVESFDDYLSDILQLVTEDASLNAVVSETYNAYEAKYNEPQLVQLLKRLLSIHDEWQTHNMMTDNLAGALGVNKICGISGDETGSARQDVSVGLREGSGTGGRSERQQQSLRTTGGSVFNQRWDEQRENIVLTLMEFLAISRAQALVIFRNHPHAQNAQAILDSVLGNM